MYSGSVIGADVKDLNENITVEFNQTYKLLYFDLHSALITKPKKWQKFQQSQLLIAWGRFRNPAIS